jgi:lipopolysaccharide export system protein LptA
MKRLFTSKILLCAVMLVVVSTSGGLASNSYAQSVVGGVFSPNTNTPIDIISDILEVNDKKKVATFRGNVSATQGDFNIKAKEIIVSYTKTSQEKLVDTQDPNISAVKKEEKNSENLADNTDISEIRAKGDVIITTQDAQEAKSDGALFEVKKQLATLTGSVRLAKGENVVTGEKAVIDLKAGTSNIINEKTEQISARFVPSKDTQKKRKTNTPIDIVSDKLEIDDKKKTAVFVGRVTVTQDNYKMNSNKIHIAYEAPKKNKNQKKIGEIGKITSNDISQVRAIGGVVLRTKDKKTNKNQIVRSNRAILEVKRNVIVLIGNVRVKNEGQGAISVPKAEVDLNNGNSIKTFGRATLVYDNIPDDALKKK